MAEFGAVAGEGPQVIGEPVMLLTLETPQGGPGVGVLPLGACQAFGVLVEGPRCGGVAGGAGPSAITRGGDLADHAGFGLIAIGAGDRVIIQYLGCVALVGVARMAIVD